MVKAFFVLISVMVAVAFSRSAFAADGTQTGGGSAIAWEKASDEVFARARREHRFVLLDLEAVWCHWCHVMDDTTYRDPRVVALINAKYVAVRVDQDSRPDLANRYEDYGWPATVVFGPGGGEIAKRRGYLEPIQMASMLQAIIDDPTPGPSVQPQAEIHPPAEGSLQSDLREKLSKQVRDFYDEKNAGWGGGYKFIDADTIEYCLAHPADAALTRMARQTLAANRRLIDPVWGGVYQYSTDGDWDHPHFEKIISYQADDLRTYAAAFAAWHDPADRASADAIHRYVQQFLTAPSGGFYVSQDADLNEQIDGHAYYKLDDGGRRKLGLPRVDAHVYARETGWMIQGLVALHAATGEKEPLAEAIREAEWIIANRQIGVGGFSHGEADGKAVYLGDTLSMGRAQLALYAATADRRWLAGAAGAADFIATHFAGDGKSPGFATAQGSTTAYVPKPQIDENIAAARFGNLLAYYTGQARHRDLARSAMRYVAAPEVAGTRRWMVGGILLADAEINSQPLHVTVVGPKDDPMAAQLFAAAALAPVGYKRIEWYDHAEGPLTHMDVDYPNIGKAAAFICSGTACQSPVTTPEKLMQKLGIASK